MVCLPSRSEPFGIALLEAGAFRRPVVASRVGGIPEIIDDADTGLLVEADDVGALVEALRKLFADPALAQAMSERLFHRVASQFTWTRSYGDYKALVRGASRVGSTTSAGAAS